MIIEMSIKFSKDLKETPVPSSMSLEIDGVSYLCTWDWTDYCKNQNDGSIVSYKFKGVAVENDDTQETYGNGMLQEDSAIKFEDFLYNEMDSDEEFEAEIISLDIIDNDISISII